jgi:putative ABC transport system permease protein
MFWRFVLKALRLRRRRLLLAFSAMAVAGALATAMFSVYSDVEKKISAQFQTYGANVVIAPAGGAVTVPLSAADHARQLGGTAAPFLYSLNKIGGQPVVLVGVDLRRAESLIQYWHIEGVHIEGAHIEDIRGDCLAGVSLGLKTGDTARLENFSCQVKGTVSTGGAEDSQIVLPFDTVARLAGVRDAASLIQVRLPVAKFAGLQKLLPDCDVRLVRAVAQTEANVVLKVRVALFLLMAVILVIVTISVSSNFGELVMERAKEIGILKAIGAGERKITELFLAESLILALFSTIVGYACGLLLAGWIDRSVFEAAFAIHFNLGVLVLATIVTLTIALSATCFAAGSIWRIQPAGILRGE